jgi:hypothetical protein
MIARCTSSVSMRSISDSSRNGAWPPAPDSRPSHDLSLDALPDRADRELIVHSGGSLRSPGADLQDDGLSGLRCDRTVDIQDG